MKMLNVSVVQGATAASAYQDSLEMETTVKVGQCLAQIPPLHR